MRYLDLIVYVLALGVLVYALFVTSRPKDAPPPAPDVFEEDGAMLPAPSAFDEQILVQVTAPKDGIGSAFAVNNKGQWVTARHVVDGCKSVGLLVGPGVYVPAERVEVDAKTDLAIITTGRSPKAVSLDLKTPLRVGTKGYHVGYPQGRPGEAATRLISRSKLVSRGRRTGTEPVLAWAEIGRTRGLSGSLGGISGGPVFDEAGNVRGVIVAESPRRGRIYTTAPDSLDTFLANRSVTAENGEASAFTIDDYYKEANRARRTLQVVKVACKVTGR